MCEKGWVVCHISARWAVCVVLSTSNGVWSGVFSNLNRSVSAIQESLTVGILLVGRRRKTVTLARQGPLIVEINATCRLRHMYSIR